MAGSAARHLRVVVALLVVLSSAAAGALPVPEIELETPTVLSPDGSPWLVWASQTVAPPGWPLTTLPHATVDVATLVDDPARDGRDRALWLHDADGAWQAQNAWYSGAVAPFTGRNEAEQADQAWARGEAPVPESDDPARTTLVYPGAFDADGEPLRLDPEPGLANLYFVRSFQVDDPDALLSLQTEVEFSAGVIVWLNGVEILRHNLNPGHEGHGNLGDVHWLPDHINQTMYRRWQQTWTGIDPGLLREGENVLAAAIYKRPNGGRRALYFDMDLVGYERPGFIRTPYLQHVQDDRVTVMWNATVPGYGYVSYGEEGGPLDRLASSAYQAGTQQEVVLPDLEPDTRYSYRVHTVPLPGWSRDVAPIVSDDRTFATAVAPGTPFTFLAYGDNRTQHEIHTALIQSMWDEAHRIDARFVISTGDLVTNASPWEEWQREFFRPALPLMGWYPYYTSLGNHEGNHESYYQFLDLPGNESWYSFTYGDAEFFALNSSAPYEPGSPQYNWFEGALAASTSRWKIVFWHHPPYACTPSRKPGDLDVQAWLVPLLETWDVDLALLGHDHLYGRSVDMEGVRYVITGGGGAPSYPAEPDAINEVCLRQFHFVTVSVTSEQLELVAINIDGEEIDRLVLSSPPPAAAE